MGEKKEGGMRMGMMMMIGDSIERRGRGNKKWGVMAIVVVGERGEICNEPNNQHH